jgi:Icc-related predicted phosphoesterase
MIIDCIGCLHGARPKLEGGDLLIITGDLTATDKAIEYQTFKAWLLGQNYKNKIVIAGNHDNYIQEGACETMWDMPGLEYLCDSGTEFVLYPEINSMEEEKSYQRQKVKIWGSPWSSQFPGINPKCCAFTYPFMHSLQEKWDLIPDDIDILITHTPPFGYFDKVKGEYDASVGDMNLRDQVMGRIKPKVHAFSHIHEWAGSIIDTNVTKFVNCSIMNENYRPVNKPVRIIL